LVEHSLIRSQSGAIVQYLVETYDKKDQITYTSSPQKYELNQWYAL